ncbi:winged helix-turn-helix domain-containing protein [soil metagenome]
MLRLTASAARLLHVTAQGLHRRPRRAATRHDVLEAVRGMGALQIDTISVVARSPYLVLFSRLGSYTRSWLDDHLADGSLFEYWAHEACYLPIEDYPYIRHRMLRPESMGWKYRAEWVAEHRHELEKVLAWIRDHGEVRSSDFERRGDHGAGWWGWKPEKRALEYLLTAGEVMVSRRQSFQRVYDLRERVHPDWSDALLPTEEEAGRQLVLRAVYALGVTTVAWVADYYRMSRRNTPQLVRELADAGELLPVHVDGWDDVGFIHPANLEMAAQAADGGLGASLTTLLSPFDPLVWDRGRARTLFDFDYRLECYTPAPKRRYGYYVLPILRRGALCGRLDAKAHRREGRFEVKALYLEDGVRASDALLADIAGALSDAAAWHDTPEVVITRTEPRTLRGPLQRLVR